jgi:hypothetical protein
MSSGLLLLPTPKQALDESAALHAAAIIAITRSGASRLRSSRRDAPVLVTGWQIFIDHVLWIGVVRVGLGAGSAIVAVARPSSGIGASRIGRGACIALNSRIAGRTGIALRTRTGRGPCAAPSTAAAFSSSAAGARPSTRTAAASAPGAAAATAPTVLGKHGRAEQEGGYECQSKPSRSGHTRTPLFTQLYSQKAVRANPFNTAHPQVLPL